jgi:probable HAF family extracellular repeat protein
LGWVVPKARKKTWEKNMKSKAFRLSAALSLLVALALSTELAAQNSQAQNEPQHHHYKLIDMGTLGGPHSYGSVNGDGFSLLNNSGVVASYADLNVPDPNAAFSCFVPDCSQAHAFRWKDGVMTDIGALPGNNNSAAGSINSRGWATGQSQSSLIDPIVGIPEFRGVLWKDGQVIDLGTLEAGTESLGIYVNDAGQVIGFSTISTEPDALGFFGFPTHTFIWENDVKRDIGTLGGADAFPATSCSGQPRNVVVGMSSINSIPNPSSGLPTVDYFLWKDGKMTDLGNLGGTMTGFTGCANHQDQVIGISTLPGDLIAHAFFWADGRMTDLGTLGGDNSEAIWLNETGEVAGSADLKDQTHHAVLWQDGKIHDLGTVPGDPCSRGRGLNARGQVVGGSSDCSNFLHAFVWDGNTGMVDLNTVIPSGSGFQLTNAFNINDRGEILAKAAPVGFTPNDDEDLGHLVLLVPCDENHPGVEGCDYSLVDAKTVVSLPVPAVVDLSGSRLRLSRMQRGRWVHQRSLAIGPTN